ncbi:MAG: helicase-associated domain-containing protein [Chloroflexi bacterium]|nr:helicase-associated domain-containing protein [Chloroflexota bacterium]MCI0577532.1 helicase-associated domain-containing protein [Chloroflexota bacterium]MCI0645629.1 helicase-associated domain-containing protein [Chloroflexota bacterium]MCI0725541.1 helicase-associated domain-containing protein [Chloroflexota bacterium]
MYPLEKALHDHDLIVLRVIGEWWELDLTGADKNASVKALAEALGRLDMVQEASFLGPDEAAALEALVAAGGRIPVAVFEREHGLVRLMGPGRLEREEPWLEPVSPAEALWYRGFLFRAFDETGEESGQELEEFYYLPDELLARFPQAGQPATPGRQPLSPVPPPPTFTPAATSVVDDLTAILAVAQIMPLKEDNLAWLSATLLDPHPERRSLLVTLAWEMELLRKTDEGARPARAALAWLKKSREAQLRDLAEAWSSSAWNELGHTPGLACEGSGWQNDPILARTALLDALPRTAEWYRLGDLVAQIKESDPDFQRPGGNYDTWYIRDLAADAYITGFANWDLVEGRLLRFLVQGPLAWLSLAELAPDGQSYRLATRTVEWLSGHPPAAEEVNVPIVVQDDATILVPFNADRYHRFQAARISQAEPVQPGKPFRYRLTPHSLAEAREQGIEPERVLQFLAEASGRPLPPSTRRAIERWAEQGTEGLLEQVVVLRVREADILARLRANPKTSLYLGEFLGDLAALVRQDEWPRLRQAAAQLGLLLDVDVGEGD